MSTPQDPRYDPYGQQSDPYPPPPTQQQGGYPGGMPPPYGEPYPEQGPVRRPGVLVVSVVLWVLTGLVTLLVGLVFAAGGEQPAVRQALDDFVAQGGLQGQIDVAALQQGVVIGGAVVAAVGALLIILALLMLGRQNWARILLTVLGVVVALLLLGTVVGTVVVLVAIVLQFLPAANLWFRQRRQLA